MTAAGAAALETARLRLQPLHPSDTDALHDLWTTEGVRRFLWDGRVVTRRKTAQLIAQSEWLFEQRGFGLWLARGRGDDAPVIGFGGFWFFRNDADLELLYGVAEPLWGQGYAREMARALVALAFGSLRFDEVRASTDEPNVASVRLLRRLGFLFDRRSDGGPGSLPTMHFRLPRGVWAGAPERTST